MSVNSKSGTTGLNTTEMFHRANDGCGGRVHDMLFLTVTEKKTSWRDGGKIITSLSAPTFILDTERKMLHTLFALKTALPCVRRCGSQALTKGIRVRGK